jgi:hypothetical protein
VKRGSNDIPDPKGTHAHQWLNMVERLFGDRAIKTLGAAASLVASMT